MISEYQKQTNRIYFFSNKISTVGKINYKPKFNSMTVLIDRLKKQLEEKVTEDIEEQLSIEQLENRLRIFLPKTLKDIDIENTKFKEYHKILVNENIVSRKDINDNKELINSIIEDELKKHIEQQEKKSQQPVLEEVEEKDTTRVKKAKRSSDKSSSDNQTKELIDDILKKNKDKKDDEKLSESDLDYIFQKLNVPVYHTKVVDIILDLNSECKIPQNLHKISIDAAEDISAILKKERDIEISKYIILALLGRKCQVYDLKNLLVRNYDSDKCKNQ